MEIESEELKIFVSSSIKNIKAGMEEQDYRLHGSIEFELAVAKTKKKGAGIRIYVVDASTKVNKEVISRIRFKTSPK